MGFGGRKFAGSASTGALLAASLLTCVSWSAAQASPGVRVLYAEPVRALEGVAAFSKTVVNRSRKLHFDAYGKRFELSLNDNARLSALLQAKSGLTETLQLYQGSLDGVAGSWVRLAMRDEEMRGMVWDGSDLYVIENAAAVAETLVTADATTGTIIFRLADTVLEAGTSFCAETVAEDQKGDAAYDSLIGELKGSGLMMQAADATVRIEIAALADAAFLNRYGDEQQARDEILLRLNNVDGIFSAQLGLEVQVPSVDIPTAGSDPFTSTTSASTLLGEVGKLRKQSPHLRSRGLTHLFTGRNLDGTTVGIAYLDSVCQQEYGAGLTEVSNRGSWIESLIAAHEIGHNFGAVHDGQGACASTAQYAFLMSPSVSSNRSTFSQCSLDMIRPRIASASCVSNLPPADLATPASFEPQRHAVSQPFKWELTVTNLGGSSARTARAEIQLPGSLSLDEAFVAGGTCTSGAGTVLCTLGDVPGGASRTIQVTLHGDTPGASPVTVTVYSLNDSQPANNTLTGAIAIDPESDVAIVLQAPASATAASAFQASYSVSNLSARATGSVDISIELPSGITVQSASLPAGICAQQSAAYVCTLSSLAQGASVTGSLMLMAQTAGTENLRVRVSGGYIDPIATNNTAEQSISVSAAPAQIHSASPTVTAAPATSGGGGGGGSTGAGLLLVLAALYTARRTTVRS